MRPHLEYGVQVWCPWNAEDIKKLEKIQEKAIKMICGLSSQSYEEKLKELQLESLSDRRKRLDMIQTYKILKGIDNVDRKIWFSTYGDEATTMTTRLSNHPLNLKRQQISKTECRKHFFSQRVIDDWNRLPDYVKDSKNISTFKSNYSLYFENTMM